jgi:Fur family zinc uptake transcriptional regulator
MNSPKTYYEIEPKNRQRSLVEALACAEAISRERGLRFTTLRRKVFELVWRQGRTIGAYEILEQLQQEGRTAPPTVYRALDFLLELGLVHRIASLNAFVCCPHPQTHHHGHFFICKKCNSCVELRSSKISQEIESGAVAAGFLIEQQRVEVMGLCAKCRKLENDE